MEFPLRTMLLLSLGPLLAREIVQGKDIKLYQTADLEVVEGDSVTLHCCWTAVNDQQYRADWLKNEVRILHQPTAVRYEGEGCGSALSPVNNGTCGCATLTLPNVTRNHTGHYVCKVTKVRPVFIQFWGNGTMITVTERRSPTNGTTQERLDRAARVIYEVPHRDSEVDGTSTSSPKGSSQWCQVPVYESFDYFERVVESKGGG
ncbi:uncharacterized protein LOC130369941 isoform X2 [Gadus chalcogrammus]|uniref:uncharacterized protein LOC130369941 isoform X2 n=1 Tax=Gadus chalcogrammus TaxID=1042646 RepID=UPI0024C4BD29|nr:uncharacterized protein LOC130369941 isoform X2 [Gadus chalcogrammus]